MLEVPVYLITGFLESGKTMFIRDILTSPDFADGTKTLLLLCEEGLEEYDREEMSRVNVDILTVEKEEELTQAYLEKCHKQYRPRRVFVEFNGMWSPAKFAGESLPRQWELVQTITLVDGSTFEMFLTNMRSMLTNLFSLTELVIFNRCTLDMDLQKYRRAVKAVNQQAMLSFEDEQGNQLQLGKEQPPYDLNAEIIDIEDVDYGLWFLDVTESPERYDGKTVRFKGKVMLSRRFPADTFVPGRNAMTCCAEDIRFMGYLCKSKNTGKLTNKQWVEVTAVVKYEYQPEYGGEGPVLYAKRLRSAQPPEEDTVYFN